MLCKVKSNPAMEVYYGGRETEIKSIPGFWGIVVSVSLPTYFPSKPAQIRLKITHML